MVTAEDFQVKHLGDRRFISPLKKWRDEHHTLSRFTEDDERVLFDTNLREGYAFHPEFSFERAGPRELLYFNPSDTRAALVTCGGLCPGLNNVTRSVVMQLYHGYGVKEVWGSRYGYRGLHPDTDHPPILLTPDQVSDIHKQGGTLLGTSRGPGDPEKMVGTLKRLKINILFTLGGDGTQRGALAIAQEAERQNYPLSVIGIPKTIDNDIPYVFRTFGYMTAVEKSVAVIDSAHNEARGALRGIGLVKLMGRDAGYIAAGATLTSQVVNYCLIPEIPFFLDGKDGLLSLLARRLERKNHAVIVVAEGAGQHLMEETGNTDLSGNKRYGDIGLFLAQQIKEHFRDIGTPVELKYLDPSYLIRSAPANAADSAICDQLARNAVHAGMSGRTNIVIGVWHGVQTHVPIPMIARAKKQLTEDGEMWQSVLKTTGQPVRIGTAPRM